MYMYCIVGFIGEGLNCQVVRISRIRQIDTYKLMSIINCHVLGVNEVAKI